MAKRASGAAKVLGRWGSMAAACPLIVLAAIAAGVFVAAVATGNLCITSTERPENRYEGPDLNIAANSPAASDRDADGIPDGEDILQGALDYVTTRPRYRNAYYQGGYPTDGCGVCTDVVAAACRAAGYDLRDLVDADIRAHLDAYADGDAPDLNIDYRRVRNLRVYFSHAATSLTADTGDVRAWQPGDIVLYADHIGIVSDRRNADGLPYLIHHANPFQLRYEEDALASYGEPTDHFRLP